MCVCALFVPLHLEVRQQRCFLTLMASCHSLAQTKKCLTTQEPKYGSAPQSLLQKPWYFCPCLTTNTWVLLKFKRAICTRYPWNSFCTHTPSGWTQPKCVAHILFISKRCLIKAFVLSWFANEGRNALQVRFSEWLQQCTNNEPGQIRHAWTPEKQPYY